MTNLIGPQDSRKMIDGIMLDLERGEQIHMANMEKLQAAAGQPILYGKGVALLGTVLKFDQTAPIFVRPRFESPLVTIETKGHFSSETGIQHTAAIVNLPVQTNREKRKTVSRHIVLSSEESLDSEFGVNSRNHGVILIGEDSPHRLAEIFASLGADDPHLLPGSALHPIGELLSELGDV